MDKCQLTIYTEQRSARLDYIVHELFDHMNGLTTRITDVPQEIEQLPDEAPLLCYCTEPANKGLHICPSGLLTEKGICPQNLTISYRKDLPVLYREGQEIDIFSAAFYLLSRYEEYLPHATDVHGRYRPEDSLAQRNSFLQLPVIEYWMRDLLYELQKKYTQLEVKERTFRHLKTIDVDNVFAYRHKGPLVHLLHLAKDIYHKDGKAVSQRLRVICRQEEDPFFNLAEIARMHAKREDSTLFFFHCGMRGPHDKKTWVRSRAYGEIRKAIHLQFACGLHPSYRAAHRPWLLTREKRRLETLIGEEVTRCRAHYLLFTLPHDYEMLEQMGFREDYTMAYSNLPGYRAGTSLPFYFYDLEQERATRLQIVPLAVMDKTLKNNLGLSAQEAEAYLLQMARTVKAVHGQFCTLFHNENQTDAYGFGWKGWKEMYQDLIEKVEKI